MAQRSWLLPGHSEEDVHRPLHEDEMNTTYDMPKDYYFGGVGAAQIQPLAIAILLIAGILILILPRKYVIVPLLTAGLLLPVSNGIVIAGLHLLAIRLLLLFGWIRVLRDIQAERGFYPKRLA